MASAAGYAGYDGAAIFIADLGAMASSDSRATYPSPHCRVGVNHPILGHRPEHRRLRFGESSNQVPAALPVSGSTTAPLSPDPRDDALAVATERRPPDVILMRSGKDAPLGRQIERSVAILITPILSGLHHCCARI
jgi:hypothetical protein